MECNKLSDYAVSESYEENKKLQTRKNSSITDLCSKYSKFLSHNDANKKSWETDDSSTILNNSTLSLHISSYENSTEADNSDSLNKSLEKSWLIKEQKQITHVSTFICQNPFHFTRQQSDQTSDPEVCQFKATQRLINSNEVSNDARGNVIHKSSGYCKNYVNGSTAVSMHYPVGKSRSQNSTILNTSTAAPSHCRSVWRHQIHRNSWLCSLIPPKFFFVSLYLLTITFWSITGMICGGKVSGSCPLGILQAFSIFNENGRVQLRKAMSSNKWHNYDPPSLIILLFAWYSITASAAGLFAFRRAHQFVRHGRYINGRAVLRVNPMYLLAPSIFGYVFTFLLLFCWTFFVVEDQLPDISHQSPNAKSILSFIFMTILPLMTIWSGFFYIIYGLVRSILFMNALLKGWSIPPPLPQRVTSFNSSGNFNGLDNHKNPQSSGSIRRYYRELAQTVSARKNDTAASTEPLNPLETTSGSVRSQKLEPIMEVPEQ